MAEQLGLGPADRRERPHGPAVGRRSSRRRAAPPCVRPHHGVGDRQRRRDPGAHRASQPTRVVPDGGRARAAPRHGRRGACPGGRQRHRPARRRLQCGEAAGVRSGRPQPTRHRHAGCRKLDAPRAQTVVGGPALAAALGVDASARRVAAASRSSPRMDTARRSHGRRRRAGRRPRGSVGPGTGPRRRSRSRRRRVRRTPHRDARGADARSAGRTRHWRRRERTGEDHGQTEDASGHARTTYSRSRRHGNTRRGSYRGRGCRGRRDAGAARTCRTPRCP